MFGWLVSEALYFLHNAYSRIEIYFDPVCKAGFWIYLFCIFSVFSSFFWISIDVENYLSYYWKKGTIDILLLFTGKPELFTGVLRILGRLRLFLITGCCSIWQILLCWCWLSGTLKETPESPPIKHLSWARLDETGFNCCCFLQLEI